MMMRISILLACLAVCAAGETPAPVVLHMSPDGDDHADGSAVHPLASLTGARDAARRLRETGTSGPVEVRVHSGEYAGSLGLDGRDHDLLFVAEPNSRPTFHADVEVKGWKVAANGEWHTHVKLAGRPPFEALWVDGRRATRARWPDSGTAEIADVTQTYLEAPKEVVTGGKKRPIGGKARQIVSLPPEAYQLLAGLDKSQLRGAELVIYHNWDVTRRRVVALEKGRIILEGTPMKTWNPWRAETPFHLENVSSACNAPGEWFLSANGDLRYRPMPGETPKQFTAPSTGTFIEARGTAERPVERVQFKGLRFVGAQNPLTAREGDPAQAASGMGAAVTVDHARALNFEDCEISHTGAWGVWFRENCHDSGLIHCELRDLGAGGIRIGSADINAPLTTHIAVDDCILSAGGRVNASAAAILLCHAADCAITHNDIADFYYTGISVGWVWGYADSPSKRNTVAYNRVRRLGQGLLSDMGGIYTLGKSEGTVVRGNVFQNIQSRGYGGWGLYTDEGSTGIVMEDNLVIGTKCGGFHQHFGRENIIRNNIFVGAKEQQLQATRVEDHRSFTFEGNIVAWDNDSPALAGPWAKIQFQSGRNCWWHGGREVELGGMPFAKWQEAGHEAGSIVADPLFVDAAKGDYRLQPNSPALKLGFKPFDPSLAGVRKDDAAWREKGDAAAGT